MLYEIDGYAGNRAQQAPKTQGQVFGKSKYSLLAVECGAPALVVKNR